ncbi:hypothetical protein GCM10008937_23060 [Deinococcus depolymerans]|uniref:Uncharacterized protein n=1 Tax=Deinococcus depolymerans TaxID=392408 RepID=A0ABN1C9R5_9DEIO
MVEAGVDPVELQEASRVPVSRRTEGQRAGRRVKVFIESQRTCDRPFSLLKTRQGRRKPVRFPQSEKLLSVASAFGENRGGPAQERGGVAARLGVRRGGFAKNSTAGPAGRFSWYVPPRRRRGGWAGMPRQCRVAAGAAGRSGPARDEKIR